VVWLAALVGAVARPGIPGPVPGTAVVANLGSHNHWNRNVR